MQGMVFVPWQLEQACLVVRILIRQHFFYRIVELRRYLTCEHVINFPHTRLGLGVVAQLAGFRIAILGAQGAAVGLAASGNRQYGGGVSMACAVAGGLGGLPVLQQQQTVHHRQSEVLELRAKLVKEVQYPIPLSRRGTIEHLPLAGF